MATRKSPNGSSATRVELDLVKEVLEGAIAPLKELPAAVSKLTTQVAVVSERLDHVVVPENCPISHDVERLQIAIRDSSHEGLANSTFRIQTKAIFAVAVFTISTLSGFLAVFLVHLLN